MMTIDCLGDMCPVPIVKIQQQLRKVKGGETFKVVTDHSCVVESIINHYNDPNVLIETDEVINGVWEIFVTKN